MTQELTTELLEKIADEIEGTYLTPQQAIEKYDLGVSNTTLFDRLFNSYNHPLDRCNWCGIWVAPEEIDPVSGYCEECTEEMT